MELFKTDVIFKSSPRVEGDVIYDVAIAESGKTKDTRFVTTKFVDDIVKLGNEQGQGVKSRFGHPNMCATTLGTYVGRYKNFRAMYRDGKKVAIADLHLDKTAQNSPNGDLYTYIQDMAKNNPDMFGNSVVISVANWYEIEHDGNTYEVADIKGFIASDLVDEPTATNNLFENDKDLGLKLTQFLDENTEIFDVLDNDEVVKTFFDRYEKHLKFNNKSDKMGKFGDKIKSMFGKTDKFEIDVTDANGEIIKVQTDNEEPIVGDAVTKEDGSPLPDGDYLLADGKTLVVSGGIITEIKEADDGAGDDADGSDSGAGDGSGDGAGDDGMNNADDKGNDDFGKNIKDMKEQFASDIKDMKEQFTSDIKELREVVEFMAKNISSDFEIENKGNDTLKKSKDKDEPRTLTIKKK